MTEVIVMESAAYQKMMGQIAKIAEFITKNEHKLQDCDFDNDVWLDSQEVADMLHISKSIRCSAASACTSSQK